MKKRLTSNSILAIPYDKGTGFCLMRSTSYSLKISRILAGNQFTRIDDRKDMVLSEENTFRNKLAVLNKAGKISDVFYQKVRPVGSQPARFYVLA